VSGLRGAAFAAALVVVLAGCSGEAGGVPREITVGTLYASQDATPGILGFNLFTHTIAGAMIVPWTQR